MKTTWVILGSFLVALAPPVVRAGGTCSNDADCNDNNPCTADDCIVPVPGIGVCVHVALSGNTCPDDGNFCTDDVCASGVCSHPGRSGVNCADDNNPCTSDFCNSTGQCTHPPRSGPACASDGNSCTNDVCASGACTHPPLPSGSACDDSNDCTSSDVCGTGGQCVGTPIPDCGGNCPFGRALDRTRDGERVLEAFRDYRDTILASTLEGRGYTALYYRHAEEVSAMIEESPRLRLQLANTLLRFTPQVRELLGGESPLLTIEDVRAIDDLILVVQRQAGAELAADLDVLRESMNKGGLWSRLGVNVETRARSPR